MEPYFYFLVDIPPKKYTWGNISGLRFEGGSSNIIEIIIMQIMKEYQNIIIPVGTVILILCIAIPVAPFFVACIYVKKRNKGKEKKKLIQ